MSSNDATPAQYTIKATKGYVDTTFTFKNDPSSVIESVKIKLDGVSMLAKTGSTLADNGAEGKYAKVTKADGTSDGTKATTTTVTEGYAYESGYYKVTLIGPGVVLSKSELYLQAGATSETVTLTGSPTGWTGYYATGSAPNLKVVSSKSTDDTKVAFTIVADAAFGANTDITIGYAH